MRKIDYAVRWAWIFAAASCLLICSGCGAAAWLSDATTIVPLAASMAASILTLIASLQGKSVPVSDLNLVSQFASSIVKSLQDLESLISQYKAAQTTDLEQNILDAANVIVANIQQFLTDTQLVNAAFAEKVFAIAQLIATQLQAWIQVIPTLTQSATKGAPFFAAVPSSAAFKSAFDMILSAPTSNPDVNAACAALKRL